MQTDVFIPCTFEGKVPVGRTDRRGIMTVDHYEEQPVPATVIAFVGVANQDYWGPFSTVLAIVMLATGQLAQKPVGELTIVPDVSLAPQEVA